MAGGEPVRTCVGCRGRSPKRDLLRVVAGEDGVVLDARKMLPGRGAYLHRDRSCVELAVKRGALARAVRASIEKDEVSNLLAALEGAIEQG